MAERLTRTSPADLEIRGDGRTVVGIAVPYNAPTEIHERGRTYTEVFVNGSFARTIAERGAGRVKFLGMHDRLKLPVGRAEVLREDAAGLYVELRASKTQGADEVLELIRDGVLDSLSIGFRPVRDTPRAGNTVERTEVRLDEVSAVPWPAYEGAAITAVRDDAPVLTIARADALARLGIDAERPTLSLTEARTRLAQLHRSTP